VRSPSRVSIASIFSTGGSYEFAIEPFAALREREYSQGEVDSALTTGGLAMSKETTCPPCGEVMRADNDDELVSKAQSHAKEKHGVDVDRDHILAGARDV
jgi:hypothetical protein